MNSQSMFPSLTALCPPLNFKEFYCLPFYSLAALIAVPVNPQSGRLLSVFTARRLQDPYLRKSILATERRTMLKLITF